MLQIRTPNSNRNGPQSELGTARFRHGGEVSLQPGSRTPVTKSSTYWNYRFFPAPPAKYGNALALQRNHVVAALPLPCLLLGIPYPELLLFAFCRYTGNAANCAGGWMLLPLCGVARPGRLCEVVRFKALRISLASNEVRQAIHAYAGQ